MDAFVRYLLAKRGLDDRALNRHVYGTLARQLSRRDTQTALTVLEVGAGAATMPMRLLEWGLLRRAEYTLLDSNPALAAAAFEQLTRWAAQWDFRAAPLPAGGLRLSRFEQRIHFDWHTANVLDFAAAPPATYDLLICHAVLDLLPLPAALPPLLNLLRPGGCFYFTLNFDGVTAFEPLFDPLLDAHIEALYHRSMDERIINGQRSGDAHSGRHLFTYLRQMSAVNLLAAGSSDWVVYADAEGKYPGDEAFLLEYILATLEGALRNHPELPAADLDAWLSARRTQLARGELIYLAHQVDVLGQMHA
ncbi:MAG: class I SAM-dependent methyltransferase [Anaerolineales bacterium]